MHEHKITHNLYIFLLRELMTQNVILCFNIKPLPWEEPNVDDLLTF